MELSLSLLPLLVAISSQHKTDSPLKKSPCFSRERYSMLRVFCILCGRGHVYFRFLSPCISAWA